MKEYPYWWDTVEQPAFDNAQGDPERVEGSAVESHLPEKADVLVVGGGYTGLAAARQLARAGAVVVVVERERVGWGASSRNGGQVLTGLKLDAAALVARYGEARARDLYAVATSAMDDLDAVIASEAIDCERTQSGHLQAAWKPSHFDAFVEEQALLARVFNHRVHLVPRDQQRTEIGSDRYHGVLVDEASRALNPARYVRGLADAATRAGAAIVEGARAARIERAGTRWRVSTSLGDVDAADVLLATNGYTNGAAPALQRRFVPVGSYIIATERLDADQTDQLIPRRRVVFDSKNFLYYFRLTTDRRLLFGGRAEFGTPDPTTTCRAAAILRDGMLAVFPQLAGVGIEYAWGGNIAFTRDQMPRAGRLDGLYYAGGYAGHGIAMATHLGAQIARRIAGEQVAHPLFDDDFPAIPTYSGTPWFLPLVGAYYQVKDWLQ